MSGFADVQANSKAQFNSVNWAKDDESSDDERSRDEVSSEDESDSSDEESVDDGSDRIKPRSMLTAEEESVKIKDVSQLSKKERQEIRKKELDDLDNLLAEFGSSPKPEEPSKVDEPIVDNVVDSSAGVSKSSSKKKKKKPQGSQAASGTTDASEAAVASVSDATEPVDVAAILKSRTKKSVKKGALGDAKSIAIAEALKEKGNASKSGKKKEKSKAGYNEFSY